jgi:hypothetical protein
MKTKATTLIFATDWHKTQRILFRFLLFNKLKGISFVILLVVNMNPIKAQFDNVYVPTGTIVPPPFQTDADFQKFPPFTLLPSSQPTYRLGFGLPPTPDAIPLLVEGNIGTNHSFPGTFGTVGGTARWNTIGDRVPLGFLPYISTTGFRSSWENFGLHVGMSQTYSGAGRDALISWQDATAPSGPLTATNRLVFGVRDGSTTDFEEVAQIATQNGALFGIGIVDSNNPFVPEEQLHLYNFRTPPDTSPLPLYQKWSNDFNPVGSRIGYPGGVNVNFQIRNDDTSSIEFWTDNQQRMTIDKTGWVGIGTGTPINIPFGSPSLAGVGTSPAIIPLFSVGGAATFNGAIGVINNVYNISDERLKENFNSLDTDWKKILNVKSYSYHYKKMDGINFSEGVNYGFKAQEVKEFLPELTRFFANGLSVNYIGFIPFLNQGLKEHEERLNIIELNSPTNIEIKEKINGLEVENKKLKNQNELLTLRLEMLEQKFDAICQIPCLQGNSDNLNSHSSEKLSGSSITLNDKPELFQNEPNPFSTNTIIRFYTHEGSKNCKILIRNAEGKLVGEYKVVDTGHGSVNIVSGTLAAGTYYYTLFVNGVEVDTKKMILINN